MNREIKFRIWSNIRKSMTYPDRFVLEHDWFGVTTEHYLDDCNPLKYPMSNYPNLIVMLYTGLRDKNGKEIYKGDICEFDNGDRFVVNCEEWLEFFADYIGEPECEDQTRDFYRIMKSKVIGNIHENPELLK